MPLNRRELLTLFLGTPAVLWGCRQSSSKLPSLPPGDLVGASDGTGHILRDRKSFEIPHDKWETKRIVIVGGGIAGLSAARHLQKAGVTTFEILELEPQIGGTARSGSSKRIGYPWGAHYVPAPTKENPALVELFDEMGIFEGTDKEGDPIVAEQFNVRDPEERIFYKGYWHEGLYLNSGATDDDLHQLDLFEKEIDKWIARRDAKGRRAFTVPMSLASDDPAITELDKITMFEWMNRNNFHSPRLRWLVDYACRDDYGMTMEQTSAWAGLFYFAARVRKPGEESRPFITWPEGNGRIVKHLKKNIAGNISTGWVVAELLPQNAEGKTSVDVIAVSHDGKTVRGIHAEKVIFAAPHFLTPYVIRPWRKNPPDHVSDFEYSVWAVANLFLSKNPSSLGFPMSWDNVLYESPSLGYVSAGFQRGIDFDETVLTYYYPLCENDPSTARKKLLQNGRDEWAEIALADLSLPHHDIRELTERLDVMRWGHAMIQPRPGFIWGSARKQAAKPYRGIHFAHSDLSGLPLFEEAFYRGTKAAEAVLGELVLASGFEQIAL